MQATFSINGYGAVFNDYFFSISVSKILSIFTLSLKRCKQHIEWQWVATPFSDLAGRI
jgi:hypothetical protein